MLKGNPGPCPDAATQTKITAAAQKLHDAIGKACGGADKAFGGPDDILPQDISTLTNCPNVTPPGAAASCAGATGRGPINTLQDLADCITCLTEFKVDCTDSIAAPGVAGALSSSCNPLCGNSKIDGSCSNDSTRLCGSTLDCVSPGTCVPFENCDDGNSATGDNCPGNCFIKTCSPTAPQHVLTVNVNAPAGATVGGLSIYIEYPDGVVSAPGTGAAVLARINDPAGVVTNANDLDYAINAILLGSPTIPLAPTEAFDITFDSCQSAPAPTLGQFRCVVVSSGDPNGVGLSGVTCSLTLS